MTQQSEKDRTSIVAEHDAELTFQPKITKSYTLPQNEVENVHERLFKEALQKRKDIQDEVNTLI